MLNFLKRIGQALEKSQREYEYACVQCGHVHKGKGRVAECEKCGAPQQTRS